MWTGGTRRPCAPEAHARAPTGPQVNPEGKYVVDIDKTIDIAKLKPNDRVALKNG